MRFVFKCIEILLEIIHVLLEADKKVKPRQRYKIINHGDTNTGEIAPQYIDGIENSAH